MKLGFIGLGKMGLNMVTRLIEHRHQVVGFAPHETSVAKARERGAWGADSLANLIAQLETPRIIWLMVPAGKPTENTIDNLISLLSKKDIIIDGGNSNYKHSIQHAEKLNQHNIHFLDIGTSGGIWGLKKGYCLMVGGEVRIYEYIEPLLQALATKNGYAYMGPSGAGHFVKMVHNGIEYGMLQAVGEGFALLEHKQEFNLDLGKIANLWNHGSVVRSWILELAENVFKENPKLENLQGVIADSGEGRWTVNEAITEGVSIPVIALALLERFRSQNQDSFSAKLIAGLRNQFGGHKVTTKE